MTLPFDPTTFTRDDWNAFDNARSSAFAPTPEEIAAQQLAIQQEQIAYLTPTLAKYNIVFTGTEIDFLNLYTEYIMGAPDMREEFGDNLQGAVDTAYATGNSLNGFYTFVFAQEG